MKLVLAFLAGLVVALGSALVFVRTRQSPPVVPVTEIQQEPALEPEQTGPELAQPEAPKPVEPSTTEAAAKDVDGTVSEEPVEKAQAKALPKTQPPALVAPKPNFTKRTMARNGGNRSVAAISPAPLPPPQVVQNSAPALPSAPQATYPALSTPPQAVQAPPQPHVVELSAGTPLTIRLGETLSTEHNYTGDAFRGTLDEPIIREGFIIADKGSKVLGRIVNATPAGRVRGASSLSLALTEINTTDGQRVRVQTNSVEKAGSKSTGTDAAKIAGGAALGAIIGALSGGGKGAAIGAGAGGAAGTGVVLAMRGKLTVMPSESRLVFQLVNPVTITEKLNR